MLKLREDKLGAKCPLCGSDLWIRIVEYDIPNYGDTIFLLIYCEKCRFKVLDSIPKEVFGKKVLKIEIKSKEDLGRKILKGERAKIKIPKYNIEVDESEGYISTIEGLLMKIRDKLISLDENVREIFDKLLNVKEEFEIIIEDEEGISREIKI